MPTPITRYRPSHKLLWAGLVALGIAIFSVYVGLRLPLVWIAAGLALATVIVLFSMAFSPAVEVYETHVRMGRRSIPWSQIRRLDRLMLVPLVVRFTTSDKKQTLLFYPGNADSANSLLRQLRRFSREALIDGISYRKFWGEANTNASESKQLPPPRYPLLLAEDEEEVERLFQRLKTVGNLDQASSSPKSSQKEEQ